MRAFDGDTLPVLEGCAPRELVRTFDPFLLYLEMSLLPQPGVAWRLSRRHSSTASPGCPFEKLGTHLALSYLCFNSAFPIIANNLLPAMFLFPTLPSIMCPLQRLHVASRRFFRHLRKASRKRALVTSSVVQIGLFVSGLAMDKPQECWLPAAPLLECCPGHIQLQECWLPRHSRGAAMDT